MMLLIATSRSVQAGEEVVELAREAAKEAISESLQAVFGAVSCISAVANVYSAGKGVTAYFYPSKKEQVVTQEGEIKLEVMELRKKLRACLVSNRKNSEKGNLGIPVLCEQMTLALGMLGAGDDVNRMVTIFNKFNK